MESSSACGLVNTFLCMLHLYSTYGWSFISLQTRNHKESSGGTSCHFLSPSTHHPPYPIFGQRLLGPLKAHWHEECWSYICAHPDRVITRYQFSDLFRKAWLKGMTLQNIVAGFHTTGIFLSTGLYRYKL